MTWAKCIAVIAITSLGWWIYHISATPSISEAQRAFQNHHTKLNEYIETVEQGNDDRRIKQLATQLAQLGFTSIRQDGKCIVFYYTTTFAAIDCWHEIVYSPAGYRNLPNYRRGEMNRLLGLTKLGNNGTWFYVIYD